MNKFCLALAIFSACSIATAASIPAGIHYVEYNRNSIPNIVTAAGIASEIIFEDDEKIDYSTFGFSSAWQSQVVDGHILVFKATDAQPETNLIVHTNKRDYLFTVTSGNNDWKANPNNAKAYYSVRMTYHDNKSKAALARKAEQQAEERTVLRNRDISERSTYINTNYDYRATAFADDLIPHRVWDNGTLTFIAFNPGAKRGVAYELDHNRKAHLVNQHTEKNGLLIVHGVYKELILRIGDQAVELRRNNVGGVVENNLKTTVKNTLRTVMSTAPTSFKSVTYSNTLNNRRLSLFSQPNASNDNQPTVTTPTQEVQNDGQ